MTELLRTLLRDHRVIAELFKRIDAENPRRRGCDGAAGRVVRDLLAHLEAEEELVYAELLQRSGADADDVCAAIDSHAVLRAVAEEILEGRATPARHDHLLSVLQDEFAQHVMDEETETFDRMRRAFSPTEARALAVAYERRKAELAAGNARAPRSASASRGAGSGLP